MTVLSPQHECEASTDSQWNLLSICEDGSVGGSDIAIIVAVLVLVAAASVGIWYWVRSRMDE